MDPSKNITKSPSSERVNFLDGIRGLAALMVLLEHVVKDFLASVQPIQYNSQFLSFITDGHFAVAIFFVLSGYVLTVSQTNRPQSLVALFIGRYCRLAIPILITSAITYILMIAGLFFIAGNTYQFTPTILGLLKFSTVDVFVNYDIEKSYSPALWTMSAELFGSYLLYLYIRFIARFERYQLILALAISMGLLIFQPFIACFFMGYLIMQLNTRYLFKEVKWTAVTCISAFVSVVVIVSLSPSLENWQRSLLAFVIVIAISYATILRKVFSNAFLLFIGKISFTLYLIQFTIICTLSAYLATQFRDHDYVNAFSANLNLVITVAICIAVAYVLNPIDTYSILITKKIRSINFRKLLSNDPSHH